MRAARFVLVAACAALVAACSRLHTPAAGAPSGDSARAAPAAANWPSYGRDYAEQRFSPLTQVNAGDIGQLGLSWYFDFDTSRGQEATPIVVDGVMYVSTAWSKVYALDAETGRMLWNYDPKVPGRFGLSACCDVVNRGVAYDRGKIFLGALDGRLIALDARTGDPLWSVQTFDQSKPYTITGAPRVARGKVYIGNGGAEYGVRGYVSAYDEDTGKFAWRFYTVPGAPGQKDGAASDDILEKLARKTWFGDNYWRLGGGGTVWDSIVYDPELNLLYVGVGNGGPWNQRIRSEGRGDNLFLSSILALDPDTGQYRWHYQETPGDSWDFTATQQITLADLTIGGVRRKVLMQAPKNGFFYLIDRQTGKLISADKFMPVDWAEKVDLATGRPVENPAARFKDKPFLTNSGASGAHNWHPMAYDPLTGLVYIPAQQVALLYADQKDFKYRQGLWALGIDLTAAPIPTTPEEIAKAKNGESGKLLAWDPVARKAVWSAPRPVAWNGGVLATGGNLVFQGLKDSTFRAYRADNGQEVWKFDTETPILPGAVSYAVKGEQYIAIVAGFGASGALLPNWNGPKVWPPGRVLVFKLGGTKILPPVVGAVAPPNPGQGKWTPAQLAEGSKFYNQICAACHSAGGYSAGVIPDLRRSGALSDAKAWRAIVLDGVLKDQGMVSFSRYLSADQVESIRGYISLQATRIGSPK